MFCEHALRGFSASSSPTCETSSTEKPTASTARAHPAFQPPRYFSRLRTYAPLMDSPHLTAMPRLTKCSASLRSTASPQAHRLVPERWPEEPGSLRQQGRSPGHQAPSRTHYPLERLQHSPPIPSTPQTPRVTRSTLPRGPCKRTRRHLCGLKKKWSVPRRQRGPNPGGGSA